MHRTIEISVPEPGADGLVAELAALDSVIGLSLQRGASVKPPGDVITVHVLNRGADEVLELAGPAASRGGSIAFSELTAIADPEHQHLVDADVDEGTWEEAETGLRHQGRITANFLALMALGGVIATVGLVSDPVPQAIALIAASIIAPGFEPVAKIALGLVLRRGAVIRRGALSAAAGYGVLIAAAAAAFLLLRVLGAASPESFVANSEVQHLIHPTDKDILQSIAAAAAGLVMITAYRRSVIAGPLIALVLIPGAAAIGASLGAGQWAVTGGAFFRLGIDVALVIGVGALVVAVKKATVHRRSPLI